MYKLIYMPVAVQDITEIIQYIKEKLQNKTAANNLAAAFQKAINGLQDFPYAYSTYLPPRPQKHEYRKIPVKNYLILYWVDEPNQTVIIARVMYAKRKQTILFK